MQYQLSIKYFKKYFVFFILVISFVANVFGIDTKFKVKNLIFQETIEDKTMVCECLMEQINDGYKVKVIYDNETYNFRCNYSFITETCEIKNRKNNMTTNIVRKNNLMTIKNETINKNIVLNNDKWYQTAFSLIGFIKSNKKEEEFLTVNMNIIGNKSNNENNPVIKMIARKEGTEIIKNNNINIETIRVTITLPGIKSLFWKAKYWYRKSDGILVRYEETRGGHGAPKIIGELIKE